MALRSAADAVAAARRALALPSTPDGSVWPVRRLDGGSDFVLVQVDARLACLDAATGALMASAAGAAPTVPLSADAALQVAALGGGSAELVWKPCAATMSMFDPLWRVTFEGQERFVDQRGRVWPALKAPGPGGA
jgi:hypothetical protein